MEEKIYFRVQENITKKDYIEFVKTIKEYKILNACILFLSIINLLFALLLAVGYYILDIETDLNIPYNIMLFLIFAIVFGAMAFGYARIVGSISYKSAVKVSMSDPIAAEVIFTENKIYDNGKNSQQVFEYHQIESIKVTQAHYILMISKNFGIIIRKDSFVFGDKNQFINFLNDMKNNRIGLNNDGTKMD